jgi:hypothetical protein
MKPRDYSIDLMQRVVAGQMSVADFCSGYEHHFNFDWPDRRDCSDIQLFQELFDEIVYFSPFPRETWEYPKYRSADEILSHVRQTLAKFEI